MLCSVAGGFWDSLKSIFSGLRCGFILFAVKLVCLNLALLEARLSVGEKVKVKVWMSTCGDSHRVGLGLQDGP